MTSEIIAADIGGTHARFAVAICENDKVARLEDIAVMRVADYTALEQAWKSYTNTLKRRVPRRGAIAMAGCVTGEVLHFTNNPWVIDRAGIAGTLGLDHVLICNDFDAVGHAVAQSIADDLAPICGPERWPQTGVITIIGPGTGLGIASVLRLAGGSYHVIPTEGGHLDFAPLDKFEDMLLARLRTVYERVSVERVVSGPGLKPIYAALAAMQGHNITQMDDAALWQKALGRADAFAAKALERFCMSLGAVAGDIAIAQGASAVVIAGGLGARLAGHLPQSGFAKRFAAKGRYQRHMEALPVRALTREEPGLFGAAAAALPRT